MKSRFHYFGAPRMHEDLLDEGETVDLMTDEGLKAYSDG